MGKRSVVLALVALFALASCAQPGPASSALPSRGPTTLRLPEASKIVNTMDPGITSGGAGLEEMQNMFEGLVYIDQVSGEIKPGQAESWTIAPDGTTYTFHMRSGLRWSDGAPLTARDFEYAWRRAIDPATRSRYAQVLYPVKGAEAFGTGKGSADAVQAKATDDRTFVVTLERPAPFFMQLVATWTAYPVRRDVIEKFGDKWTATKESYVSNGHYRLVEWVPEQSMTVEKNTSYWGENNGPDKIVWTLYDSAAAKSVAAYENDELDRAILSGADVARAKADEKLSKEIKKFPREGSTWVVLDTTSAPLSDVRVRRALAYATDGKRINGSVLKDAYFDPVSIVAPGVPGAKKENGLGYDLAKAKQLLADAGYPEGRGWPANVKLTYIAEAGEQKTLGEALQGMWKAGLGIDIVLEPMEGKSFDGWRKSLKDRPYGMYFAQWGSDYEDPNNWYNLLFDSKADYYFTHWKSARFDDLVRQGLQENDAAKRVRLYEEADKILNEEAPLITLYHPAQFDLIKPYVKGLTHYRVLGRIQGYLVRIEK